jgi:hypothetical protein
MQLDQAEIVALTPEKSEWQVNLALRRQLRVEKHF